MQREKPPYDGLSSLVCVQAVGAARALHGRRNPHERVCWRDRAEYIPRTSIGSVDSCWATANSNQNGVSASCVLNRSTDRRWHPCKARWRDPVLADGLFQDVKGQFARPALRIEIEGFPHTRVAEGKRAIMYRDDTKRANRYRTRSIFDPIYPDFAREKLRQPTPYLLIPVLQANDRRADGGEYNNMIANRLSLLASVNERPGYLLLPAVSNLRCLWASYRFLLER